MKNLILSLTVFLLFSVSAEAKPRNQRREVRQDARIQQGAQSGQLTEREQAGLNKRQARIDRAQDKAGADGVYTDAEKYKLEKMQDHQSRAIYRQKHDAQTTNSANVPDAPQPAE